MTIEPTTTYRYRYSKCDHCGSSINGNKFHLNFRPGSSQLASCRFPHPFQAIMCTNHGLIINLPEDRVYQIHAKGEFLIKLELGKAPEIIRCDDDDHICQEPEE
ncbi:MAG: hypothetical protein K2X08_02140 [Chlamydiales bacterium]|nr:hypothetical protein [Chlamydiales bacterium]